MPFKSRNCQKVAGNRTQSEAHIEIEVLTVQLEEAKEEIRGLKAASQEALLNGDANSAAQEMLKEQIEKQNKLNIRVEELMCELDKSQTNIQAYERMLEIERNKYEEELLDQKVHYEKEFESSMTDALKKFKAEKEELEQISREACEKEV